VQAPAQKFGTRRLSSFSSFKTVVQQQALYGSPIWKQGQGCMHRPRFKAGRNEGVKLEGRISRLQLSGLEATDTCGFGAPKVEGWQVAKGTESPAGRLVTVSEIF
jgi:hypothetical protein